MRGKVAIVTGASRGIGRAIALTLAGRGARCVLCARDREKLQAAVAEIRTAGGQADAIALDLRKPDAPARLVDFAIELFGRLEKEREPAFASMIPVERPHWYKRRHARASASAHTRE